MTEVAAHFIARWGSGFRGVYEGSPGVVVIDDASDSATWHADIGYRIPLQGDQLGKAIAMGVLRCGDCDE